MTARSERMRRIGNARFDPLSGDLSLDGRTVRLRPRTAALLDYLSQHADRVVSKGELLEAIWPNVVVTEDSLAQCVKEVRRALAPDSREWIRTLPRHGYAFIGQLGEQEEPDHALELPQTPSSLPKSRLRTWQLVAGLLLLAAVALAASLAYRWQTATSSPVAARLSLVVMPIVNATGDPAHGDAVDDLTDALTDALARTAGITVIASGTAFAIKGRVIDTRQIGRELAVRYVLEGALHMEGQDLVLTMRLADAAKAVQVWNQEFRASGTALLRDMVVGRVADTLGLHMARADTNAENDGAPAANASELLSEVRASLRHAGAPNAYVRSALEVAMRSGGDADAEGWAMLATSYVWGARLSRTRETDLQSAEKALARALALAPDNDKVRVAEGLVYGEVGNQARALAAYERALALNPNSAPAHAGRGDVLIMLGRPDEALVAIEHAMRISPYDPKFFVWELYAGVAHLHLRHNARALELLQKVAREHPEPPVVHLLLAGALGASGRVVEAREQMQQVLRARPDLTLTRFREIEPSNSPEFLKQRVHLYAGLRAAGIPE